MNLFLITFWGTHRTTVEMMMFTVYSAHEILCANLRLNLAPAWGILCLARHESYTQNLTPYSRTNMAHHHEFKDSLFLLTPSSNDN